MHDVKIWYRSRTLDALVVPNTPTSWIKTPPPLTQHGAKRVPRIQSSLNKRQPGYEMYLNGHLPRSGKLLRVQLLILPAVGHKGKSQHLVLDLFLLLFTWPLYLACWTYCHTCGTGQTQCLKVLCEVWTHAEKPAKKHCPGRIRGSHLGLFLRNLECHYCSGFPYSLGTVPSFFYQLWAWVRNMDGHLSGQCIISTLQEI